MLKLKIEHDDDPSSPREWDNLGIMVCFHGRYNLGDEHDLREDSFNTWDDIKAYLVEEEGALHILPLYLYDHSGIIMSTGPFGCPWDSGQVGFIYTTAELLVKMGTPDDKVEECLKAEVEVYSKYIEGDTWGYTIEDEEGEIVDSCWGFYGEDDAESEGKAALEHLEKAAEEEGPLGMYRIVVALDVEARSMEEAYRRVYRRMQRVDCKNFQWESTDEWYTPEAEALEPGDVQDIRMKVFGEENPSCKS